MSTKISAGSVTTVLKAAGFIPASWNRSTEYVSRSGFISSFDAWAGDVQVNLAQRGYYSVPSAAELEQNAVELASMSDALTAKGYIVEIKNGFNGEKFLAVRKAA